MLPKLFSQNNPVSRANTYVSSIRYTFARGHSHFTNPTTALKYAHNSIPLTAPTLPFQIILNNHYAIMWITFFVCARLHSCFNSRQCKDTQNFPISSLFAQKDRSPNFTFPTALWLHLTTRRLGEVTVFLSATKPSGGMTFATVPFTRERVGISPNR